MPTFPDWCHYHLDFDQSIYHIIGLFLGRHTMSGACIEPVALQELFPDWKERGVRIFKMKVTRYLLLSTGH